MGDASATIDTEVRDISSAAQAERVFRQVSGLYPGLETAQAVAVAILGQEQNFDPRQLGDRLMHDAPRVRELTRQANNAHRGRNVYEIKFDYTLGVILADFELAKAMLSFDPAVLHGLLDEFSEARKSYEGKQAYRKKVLDLVEKSNNAQDKPDKSVQRVINQVRKKAGIEQPRRGFRLPALVGRLMPSFRPRPKA